ncbi:MAG TPA: hypothetical protein VLR47_07315, partial [Rhodospirillales bacterium]|nr:hypothetical protein [Rhodospirillales bacterium]
LTDFQNVQDQQRSKFQQEDAFARSQGLVIQNLIALYRSMGGGWAPVTDRPAGPGGAATKKAQKTNTERENLPPARAKAEDPRSTRQAELGLRTTPARRAPIALRFQAPSKEVSC